MPDGTSVDMGSFSSFTTSSWSYLMLEHTPSPLEIHGEMVDELLTTSWSDDMFPFDYEAWDDTDGDGLTDYIDPNSTVNDSYTTVQQCSGGEVWDTATYSNPSSTFIYTSSEFICTCNCEA